MLASAIPLDTTTNLDTTTSLMPLGPQHTVAKLGLTKPSYGSLHMAHHICSPLGS